MATEVTARQLLDRADTCQLYHYVCSGNQLNDNIVDIVVYMRDQLRCWGVPQDETLPMKDNVLLCLSTLSSALKKKLCLSGALLDSMKDSEFSLIVSKLCCITWAERELLDCSDMSVSYSACRFLYQVLSQLSVKDSSAVVQRLLTTLTDDSVCHYTGWIHTLDLFQQLLHNHTESDIGGCVFTFLTENWTRVVDIIFSTDFRSKLSSDYDIVIFSFCRLWSQLIKFHRKQEVVMCCDDSIVDSTGVLLVMLKSDQLPILCRGKCLSILLQTVNQDPSSHIVVPAWMLNAADRTVKLLHTYNADSDSSYWSFSCCQSTADQLACDATSRTRGILKSSLTCAAGKPIAPELLNHSELTAETVTTEFENYGSSECFSEANAAVGKRDNSEQSSVRCEAAKPASLGIEVQSYNERSVEVTALGFETCDRLEFSLRRNTATEKIDDSEHCIENVIKVTETRDNLEPALSDTEHTQTELLERHCATSSLVTRETKLFRHCLPVCCDVKLLRKLILLLLRSLDIIAKQPTDQQHISDTWQLLDSLNVEVKAAMHCDSLVDAFIDQDDFLIEALLRLASIHSQCSSVVGRGQCMDLDPLLMFLTLLDRTGWDYSLLLDFIMSPETYFLIYLVRILKQVTCSWSHWEYVCNNFEKRTTAAERDGCPDLCSRSHKRKSAKVGPGGSLSLLYSDVNLVDAESVIRWEEGHLLTCAANQNPPTVDMSNQKRSVVDYSSSSDEDCSSEVEPAASGSTVCGTVTVVKKQRVDSGNLEISSDDRGRERLLRKSSGTLAQSMTVLGQLQQVVSRLVTNSVFPFNVEPLVRHLRRCHALYAGENKELT